jgi:hypothetical protein
MLTLKNPSIVLMDANELARRVRASPPAPVPPPRAAQPLAPLTDARSPRPPQPSFDTIELNRGGAARALPAAWTMSWTSSCSARPPSPRAARPR